MPDNEPAETESPRAETSSDYISDRTFADFPISEEALKGIQELGYEFATPVQAATIDIGLAGRDMLVRAKTGTGKTCAFSVPAIERIPDGSRKAGAVILAPTRELAQQIAEECEAISKYRDINVAVLVGGLAMGPQEKALEAGAELIVGTPGRVLDHIRRGNLDLSTCHVAVLDEADEMLSMGFFQDVTKILDQTQADRQVLLFSATISSDTQRLVKKYLKDPENVQLSTDGDNVDLVHHVLYETRADTHKIRSLLYLIDIEEPTSAIIFCNTREDTATVATYLDKQGLDAQLISGELSQARRSKVMEKVKGGEVRFLVATDVAARGIDISDLSHVINYSLPQDPAVYLHRTGRTGRIGKSGIAISLVGGTDLSTRNSLVNVHKIPFETRELPSAEVAVARRVDRQAKQIQTAMSTMVFESYLPTVRALKERPDGDALLAAALRAFFQWDRLRRAAAGGVDSIGEIRRARDEKADRKRSGGRRDRDDRGGRRGGRDDRGGRRDRDDRGGRRDRDDRGGRRGPDDRPRNERGPSTDDLESALVAEGDAKPKRKRKRRRSGGSSGGDAGAEGKSSAPAKLDDLDSLLRWTEVLVSPHNDLFKALCAASRVLLTGPVGPDGDSIGACLALQAILEARGVPTDVAGTPSYRYDWLPGADRMVPDDQLEAGYDAVVVLDGDRHRLPAPVEALFAAATLRGIIDHHGSTRPEGYTHFWLDGQAPSTCEMIYGALEDWGVPLSRPLAEQLYTGAVFDTGAFRYSNTTPATHQMAARLVDTGIEHAAICTRVLLERRQSGLLLAGHVFSHVTYHLDGQLAIGRAGLDLKHRFGNVDGNLEGIVDALIHILGVEVAVLLVQLDDREVKYSLRSRGKVNVSKVAKELAPTGGGHPKAAGASICGTVEQAATMAIDAIRPRLQDG